MAEEEITKGATEKPVTYMKNKRGTISKETDPQEIARLRGLGWTEAPTEEGIAIFAEKAKVVKTVLEPAIRRAEESIAAGKGTVTPAKK